MSEVIYLMFVDLEIIGRTIKNCAKSHFVVRFCLTNLNPYLLAFMHDDLFCFCIIITITHTGKKYKSLFRYE